MLERLKELLQPVQSRQKPLDEADRRLACAALLVEVAVIDNEFDGEELATLKQVLVDQFSVPGDEIDGLIAMAQNESSKPFGLASLRRQDPNPNSLSL